MYIPTLLLIVFLGSLAFILFQNFKRSKKPHGYLINLSIELNIDKIIIFLRKYRNIKDLSLTDDDKESVYWSNSDVLRKYYLDLLPNGNCDIVYHRSKNAFSHLLGGIDCFDSPHDRANKYIKDNTIIKKVSWGMWREFIFVDVIISEKEKEFTKVPIILVPVDDIGHLINDGEFKKNKHFDFKREKIKVPMSFDSSDKAEEFIEVWKNIGGHGNWVTYNNSLVTISAVVPSKCQEEY